jgi:hypothetical protein
MYTTYQDIQSRFPTITLDEDLVNGYILEAQEWINEQTGTSFAPTVSSATPRIYSTKVLTNTIVIDYAYEVQSVEFLVGRTISGDTWAIVDPTTYRVTPENTSPKSAIEFIDSLGLNYPIYFEGNDANVRVMAKWGYLATVPPEIKRIATQYVISIMRQDGSIDNLISSEKVGDASITYSLGKSSYDIGSLASQLSKYKDYGDIRL